MLTLERQEVFRRVPLDEVEPAGPIRLNEEQERAFQGLEAMSRAGAGAALLYGVTGSGKTQVYLRLIQETLARGRTALVLVPEIALTPQLLRIFAAHFGGQIGVLHSSLRAGERYDEWKRIRRGEARVVIGTRSAVFAPLEQLGLVILDEEQEASYKSENNPRYHARDVAKYRCVQSGALLVMGSATPSVETMYSAQTGRCGLFTLKERFNRRALPQVQVVDMKEELRAGNGRAISRPLQQALEDTLVRGEQAILFLNRRGASRMVSCGECRRSAGMPPLLGQADLPLGQRPADVPLLRLLPAPAARLPGLRREAEFHRGGHPEGPGGAGGALSRDAGAADGYGHRHRRPFSRGHSGGIPPGEGPFPGGDPDGGKRIGL